MDKQQSINKVIQLPSIKIQGRKDLQVYQTTDGKKWYDKSIAIEQQIQIDNKQQQFKQN